MVWLGIQLGVGSLVVLGSFLYQTGIRIAIINYLAIIGTVVMMRTMLWWYYRGTKRRTTSSKTDPLRICFLHPDLGIGGAEKLVVDTAILVKKKGHEVSIVTCHHDKSRCFQPTIDGTLNVRVAGSGFPRAILGRFQLPCAIVRFFIASFSLLKEHQQSPFDIIFVDQISETIPLLKWSGAKVLFYCHFPDQLLTSRTSLLKRLYRFPLDRWEETSTGDADRILVNSEFTARTFRKTFTSITVKPSVLYPCVDPSQYAFNDQVGSFHAHLLDSDMQRNSNEREWSTTKLIEPVDQSKPLVLLSLNRFERKKNIALSIKALAAVLKKQREDKQPTNIQLYIAGGYDPRLAENVEHLEELKSLASSLEVSDHVTFFISPPDERRNQILRECFALLYTPSNEHFGIVPLEAALASKPVVACNSGGPLETIVDGVTGFLREPEPSAWAAVLCSMIRDQNAAVQLGRAARARVLDRFSVATFQATLERVMRDMLRTQD